MLARRRPSSSALWRLPMRASWQAPLTCSLPRVHGVWRAVEQAVVRHRSLGRDRLGRPAAHSSSTADVLTHRAAHHAARPASRSPSSAPADRTSVARDRWSAWRPVPRCSWYPGGRWPMPRCSWYPGGRWQVPRCSWFPVSRPVPRCPWSARRPWCPSCPWRPWYPGARGARGARRTPVPVVPVVPVVPRCPGRTGIRTPRHDGSQVSGRRGTPDGPNEPAKRLYGGRRTVAGTLA